MWQMQNLPETQAVWLGASFSCSGIDWESPSEPVLKDPEEIQ